MKDTIKTTKQLLVIGGGAAGFFCAVNAARLCPGLRVTILEKSGKLLSKVRVSGGGRCNITHACYDIEEMSRRYPRGRYFVRKAFHEFFTTDTIKWFTERGVAIKEEADGRMFPVSDSSQSVIDCLLKEANRFGVAIRMQAEVKHLHKTGEHFELLLADQSVLHADFVCVATGGYPKPGMFDWLRETGHTIEEPVPSLFTFNIPASSLNRLMGISVPDVKIKISSTRLEERGSVLITHWGLSGPAILRLSAWGARELARLQWNFSIIIHWVPDLVEKMLQEQFQQFRREFGSQKLTSKSPLGLPARLWEYLAELAGIPAGTRWADLPSKEQNKLIHVLVHDEYRVSGKTTFKEEFVTAGGIDLAGIEPHTMMSRRIPGLFFAGEVMDVDAITGGYNFQHAWTSGFIAASTIASMK